MYAGLGLGDGGGLPRSLRVLGRPSTEENADICGEYIYRGVRDGRGIYQQAGKSMALYYFSLAGRWVIDRKGVTDSEFCVAFAEDTTGLEHPAGMELVWRVWDNMTQTFLQDTRLFIVDAPEVVSIVGRETFRENTLMNGEYKLVAMHHGRPAYQHCNGEAVIKFDAEDNRWLLCRTSDVGRICGAFAEAPLGRLAPSHPGFWYLEWTFWEPERNAFVPDPRVRALAAPQRVHFVGSPGELASTPSIFGTYILAGAREGYPLYVLPGTQTVIRHSAQRDRWLVDVEGLSEPSVLSRLYQWIFNGDGSGRSDRCSAFAQANGTCHPAHPDLEWLVLDPRTMRHTPNAWVRATQAPLVLRVQGRCPHTDNGIIDGDYVLVGTYGGLAAYRKPRTQCVIRYHPGSARWVIGVQGFNISEECAAYSEQACSLEHPAGAGPWYVFETSYGFHVENPFVTVTAVPDGPERLAALESLTACAPACAPAELSARAFRYGGC